MLRTLAAIAGLAVVATATYANIEHVGGFTSTEAPLIITVAVLLGVGMGFAAMEWRDRSKIGAAVLALCLIAGETYWLLLNTEREVQRQDALERPVAEQREMRTKAERRVADAKKAKQKADEAALGQAALPGCRQNCAKLLADAVVNAKAELAEAESALKQLPRPATATALADRVGLPRWLWDLVMGSLRGLAVFGGSIAFALAIHPRQHKHVTAQLEPVEPPLPAEPGPRAARGPIAAPAREREHVAGFLHATLRPDPAGSASLRQLHERYPVWCREQSVDPLAPATLGQELRTIVDAIGLKCQPVDGDVLIRGARFGSWQSAYPSSSAN